jgi:hypothetical protein
MRSIRQGLCTRVQGTLLSLRLRCDPAPWGKSRVPKRYSMRCP